MNWGIRAISAAFALSSRHNGSTRLTSPRRAFWGTNPALLTTSLSWSSSSSSQQLSSIVNNNRRSLTTLRRARKINLDYIDDDFQPTMYTLSCPPTDHDVLQNGVWKHAATLHKFLENRPIPRHTQQAFDEFLEMVWEPNKDTNVNLVLDSGCGTGRSTLYLATRVHNNPSTSSSCEKTIVVGVDRSAHRLSRNPKLCNFHEKEDEDDDTLSEESNNHQEADDDDDSVPLVQQIIASDDDGSSACDAWLVRADLTDFWRLLYAHKILVQHHYILYPNPWPKVSRWKRRFYGESVFPLLLLLGSERITLRSNWRLFLQEWDQCFHIIAQGDASESESPLLGELVDAANAYKTDGPQLRDSSGRTPAWTNFERKYMHAGERIYELEYHYFKKEQTDDDVPPN